MAETSLPALTPDLTETISSETIPPFSDPHSPLRPSSTLSEPLESLAESWTIDQPLHPFHGADKISAVDVSSDPILSKIAKQQGVLTSTSSTFKARPVPENLRKEGQGPRLSKAAAMRMGVEAPVLERERKEVDFAAVPGHKRNNLSLNVASLSKPTVAPRANRASLLRSGEVLETRTRKTPEEIAAGIAVSKAEEKEKRRQSVCVPASLTAPSITPRENRASMLRTGGGPPVSFNRIQNALGSTSAGNLPPISRTSTRTDVSKGMEEKKLERRKSLMGTIKSLSAPSIAPRSNKSAMLRTNQPPAQPLPSTTAKPVKPTSSKTSTAPSAITTSSQPLKSAGTENKPAASTISRRTSMIVPKPTKSSLLRAGIGAKVLK